MRQARARRSAQAILGVKPTRRGDRDVDDGPGFQGVRPSARRTCAAGIVRLDAKRSRQPRCRNRCARTPMQFPPSRRRTSGVRSRSRVRRPSRRHAPARCSGTRSAAPGAACSPPCRSYCGDAVRRRALFVAGVALDQHRGDLQLLQAIELRHVQHGQRRQAFGTSQVNE